MGKYTFARQEASKPRNMGVHPLMRGIGCVMMVLVPILSYGIAVLLVPVLVARGVPIPPGWLGLPAFPPFLLNGGGFASQLIIFLASQNNLIANVVFAIAIIVVLGRYHVDHLWLHVLHFRPAALWSPGCTASKSKSQAIQEIIKR